MLRWQILTLQIGYWIGLPLFALDRPAQCVAMSGEDGPKQTSVSVRMG